MHKIKEHYDIVVVGAGIAGLSAIKKIREQQTQLSILLLSNEDRLPYKRTKINKHIALGFSKNQFSLLDENWYTENNVDLVYDKLQSLKKEQSMIELASGNKIIFTKLLLATGALPNKPAINGVVANELFHVHFAKNVENLMSFISGKKSFLIIGGGVEGVETADQLIKLHKQVTIVERNENPLKRLFPDTIAQLFYEEVRKRNVNLLTETEVTQLEKTYDNKYEWKYQGKTHTFDGVIVCAGTKPNIHLAQEAGLEVNRGIIVNEFMQTSQANIFAAGDVAEHDGGLVTGLWHPAEHQGVNAGENMLRLGKVYKPVPMRLKTQVFGNFYFSANFMKCKSQNAKVVNYSQCKLFTELYVLDNKIQGLVMMNDKKHHKIYHKAVAENLTIQEFDTLLRTQ